VRGSPLMPRVGPFVIEGFARRTSCVPFLHELGTVGGVNHGLPAAAGQPITLAPSRKTGRSPWLVRAVTWGRSNERPRTSASPDLQTRRTHPAAHISSAGMHRSRSANPDRPHADSFATFFRLSPSRYKINPCILLPLLLGIPRAVRLRSA